MTFRPCAVIPTYDNTRTVGDVARAVRSHVPLVIVVDDGSGPEGKAACAALATAGVAVVFRLEQNRGKGGAVKFGFEVAAQHSCSHVFQVDADGQHDLSRMPEFLRAAAERPEALVLGYPVYDETAPRTRLVARRFTKFWVDLETGRRDVVRDALIGFRVYPLQPARESGTRSKRMAFDVEIVVRMARARVPIVNLPVGVRYLTKSEGGVSHFRPLRDILHLSLMHSRICTGIMLGWLGLGRLGRLAGLSRQ
ncbi:MAG TPA: glycosyltransferase family 2 protein [Planctomycetota bacterium]|nr:glycosyltransferase family 2 protein [Planctomycetota bacterium]